MINNDNDRRGPKPGGRRAAVRDLQRTGTIDVRHGDCLDVLRTLADASIDAVVTDPPYELTGKSGTGGFMGKAWDGTGIAYSVEMWAECLRVLRPGGHLAAFGGTRTYHRMACAVEDAGFEIRDSIGYGSSLLAWSYGSGFPKSLNVNRDARFCQCVPGVRDAATDDAAESAAQVLLAEMHGDRTNDSADVADLHGVPVDVRPDFAVSGSAQQDVFADVRIGGDLDGSNGSALRERSAGDGGVRAVRHAGTALAEPRQEEPRDVLRHGLQREGERRPTTGQPVRRDRDEAPSALRRGEPGVEGRSDDEAAEGQLRRPGVRPLPTGSAGHGEVGRLRDGAPASDGALDWSPADTHRVREPHRSQPATQPPVEPRSLADERGSQAGRGWPLCPGCGKPRLAPGLGTALKPAWEPIVLARKPLVGTVAVNVQAHGTGALNVDGCRVAYQGDQPSQATWNSKGSGGNGSEHAGQFSADLRDAYARGDIPVPQGRWPANVLLSHSPQCGDVCQPGCPVAELDAQSGTLRAGERPANRAGIGYDELGEKNRAGTTGKRAVLDSGGASRFFPTFRYQAKAPTSERPKIDGVSHPTVKPLALMQWLVRLITPPGGVVLDPFAGSGTTGQAASLEGFDAILIEREADYLPLIAARCGIEVTAADIEHDKALVEPEPIVIRDPILVAISEALDRDALVALWRANKDAWTDEHTLASKARQAELDTTSAA